MEEPRQTVPKGCCQNTERGSRCFQSTEGLLFYVAYSTCLHPFPYRGNELIERVFLPPQELRSQKQKIVSERERIQVELDHLLKCLALPAMHWPRGHFKGYPR